MSFSSKNDKKKRIAIFITGKQSWNVVKELHRAVAANLQIFFR